MKCSCLSTSLAGISSFGGLLKVPKIYMNRNLFRLLICGNSRGPMLNLTILP